MTKQEYSKLLTRPEWKAFRLEVFKRDDNKCVKCGNEAHLHAHHLYYDGDTNPWEYPLEALVTLCQGCHKAAHKKEQKVPSSGGFFMVFERGVDTLQNLKSLTNMRLIHYFLIKSEFNTGIVRLTPADRLDMMLMLGITTQQVTNALQSLRKQDVISGSRGKFTINPYLFWKGTMEERAKLLTKQN